jgi:hypothetical protein
VGPTRVTHIFLARTSGLVFGFTGDGGGLTLFKGLIVTFVTKGRTQRSFPKHLRLSKPTDMTKALF